MTGWNPVGVAGLRAFAAWPANVNCGGWEASAANRRRPLPADRVDVARRSTQRLPQTPTATPTVSLPAMTETLLRPDLLADTSVLLAAADPPSRFGEAIAQRCAELGAGVDRVVVDPTGDEAARGSGDVVVWDGASLAGPRDVLDGAWLALRPAAAR